MAQNPTSPWFKDAVFYEIHLRAFFDSDEDGIGDIKGLIQKLDYLEDLGVNTLWLLPFFPSPLKDDGYDVVDFLDVHPDYGTLKQFKNFLADAHARGMRVVMDIPLIHTSDQHPWFKRARKSPPGSKYRDYYLWHNNRQKFTEARVIFSDFESTNWAWDPEAGAYYWHRFYRHQPALNYHSPEVQKEMFKVFDFWIKMGVDGFRLSSVPFLFAKEGTTCENLPETHAFLKKLRKHVEKQAPACILLAEANMWPEEAGAYFGQDNECHMNFHFPLMPRLFMALHTEDGHPVKDILELTPPASDHSQWALFLRNHDEMTLEMVTEEEKDYLYKAYAVDPKAKINLGIRRRLAPMMGNDRRKIELLYTLLFSLPGSPVIYYGDEIGMGDNVYLGDRFGVRTPMQWNADSNAGFSRGNPQKLYLPVVNDPLYRHETVNVANQQGNTTSLLWWVKQLISMRKRLKVLGRGSLQFLDSSNAKVLAYARTWQNQRIIVVSNLSNHSQAALLRLDAFKDCELTEVFSQNKFLPVQGRDYPITIGPYGYFWLSVDETRSALPPSKKPQEQGWETEGGWDKLLDNPTDKKVLEREILPAYLGKVRWFPQEGRTLREVHVEEHIPVRVDAQTFHLLVVEVHFAQGVPESYFLPLGFVLGQTVPEEFSHYPRSVLGKVKLPVRKKEGWMVDAFYTKVFRDYLFHSIRNKTRLSQEHGRLLFTPGLFTRIDTGSWVVESELLKADHENTYILYNNQYFFKAYRRVFREMHPEMEMLQFLSERASFKFAPRLAGSLIWQATEGGTWVFGVLQDRAEHQGDAWQMTTDAVGRYFERVFQAGVAAKAPKVVDKALLRFEEAPELIRELIGSVFYQRVTLLAQRTAQLHQALHVDDPDPEFATEKFSAHYQRSLYSSFRRLVKECFSKLRSVLPQLPESTQVLALQVVSMEASFLEKVAHALQNTLEGYRTRIHGDLQLEQVLFTGKDFLITDFEGEPGTSIAERKSKKSPLKDVASMMRSIHYAAYGKIMLNDNYRDKDRDVLEMWAEQWQHYTSRFFLDAYQEAMGKTGHISKDEAILLNFYLLEKAIQELGYELTNQRKWVDIPLRGILGVVKSSAW